MIGVVSQNGHSVLPVPIHTKLNPADVITLDGETYDCAEQAIAHEMAKWDPPSNIKDEEKIKERRVEAMQKIREKSALLDAAPFGCFGIKTNKILKVFNGLDKMPYKLSVGEVVSCGNEAAMLYAVREELNKISSDQTVLSGFNIKGFDLPKFRIACARNRIKLPEVMKPKAYPDEVRQPVVDLMEMFLWNYTSQDRREKMISLKEVAYRLGLPNYKEIIDGSKVPGLIKNGEFRKVFNYNSVDLMAEDKIFYTLTSESKEMR
jgi:uncharacterized protein YukJ